MALHTPNPDDPPPPCDCDYCVSERERESEQGDPFVMPRIAAWAWVLVGVFLGAAVAGLAWRVFKFVGGG